MVCRLSADTALRLCVCVIMTVHELFPAQRRRRLGYALRRLRLLEEAERLEGSLIRFFEAAWPEIDPAPLALNWHHEAIAEHLEAVAYGEIRKLRVCSTVRRP